MDTSKRSSNPKWKASVGASGSIMDAGRASLSILVQAFGAPVSEEHAIALIYEACRTLSAVVATTSAEPMREVTHLDHVLVRADGSVDPDTFRPTGGAGRDRAVIASENKAITELGYVIFAALDYGLSAKEERQLSPELESLLEVMTSVDEQPALDDEGIESDHVEKGVVHTSGISVTVMRRCCSHLSVAAEGSSHFRAVCRAFVAEANELHTFLEKVMQFDADRAEELAVLGVQDWAHLWVQCVSDLRQGVKLKKTEYSKTAIEYALTPYEMLMDDIRSRKYKLNKVTVDGRAVTPAVKKDAHNVILDFIRSRPPLRRASDRQLQPLQRESTPVELLMESIRNTAGRSSLRKTTGPRRSSFSASYTPRAKPDPKPKQRIHVDANELNAMLDFNGDEDETDASGSGATSASCSRQTSVNDNDDEVEKISFKKDGRAFNSPSSDIQRRHTITSCSAALRNKYLRPEEPASRQRKLCLPPDMRLSSSSLSSSASTSGRTSPASGRTTPISGRATPINVPQMHANLQAELLQSETWANALKTLDLTLEEVVHIRSVLTRAELDGLPLDGTLKDDVERGKICFLCMKTRFGLFNWGVRCQLCNQQVCSKCYSKMDIPLDHFSSVPASALSPRTMWKSAVRIKERIERRPSLLAPEPYQRQRSAGSAPTSPEAARRKAHWEQLLSAASSVGSNLDVVTKDNGPKSMPEMITTKISKSSGVQVCTDCREMLLQVIRAQTTAKRFQMTQSFYVNNNNSTKGNKC